MKKKSGKKENAKKPSSKTVQVLYQNIGGEVYAFAQVGTEVYFGKVPVKSSAKETLAHLMEKEAA